MNSLKQHNHLDLKLYAYAKELFLERVKYARMKEKQLLEGGSKTDAFEELEIEDGVSKSDKKPQEDGTSDGFTYTMSQVINDEFDKKKGAMADVGSDLEMKEGIDGGVEDGEVGGVVRDGNEVDGNGVNSNEDGDGVVGDGGVGDGMVGDEDGVAGKGMVNDEVVSSPSIAEPRDQMGEDYSTIKSFSSTKFKKHRRHTKNGFVGFILCLLLQGNICTCLMSVMSFHLFHDLTDHQI